MASSRQRVARVATTTPPTVNLEDAAVETESYNKLGKRLGKERRREAAIECCHCLMGHIIQPQHLLECLDGIKHTPHIVKKMLMLTQTAATRALSISFMHEVGMMQYAL